MKDNPGQIRKEIREAFLVDKVKKEVKKKKKMLRQALNVSIDELRKLADELDKQRKEEIKKLGIKDTDYLINQVFLVGIINKEPECSDTWMLEK